jgi:serine protease Do
VSTEFMRLRRSVALVGLISALVVAGVVGAKTALAARSHPPGTRAAATAPAVEAGSTGLPSADGFAPVVARALPAVVNISSSKKVKTDAGQTGPLFSDPFFRQFFGNQFGRQFQVPRERLEKSLGSGVIVSPDGYILTNNHVVEGASDVEVSLSDKRQLKAKVVGTDRKTDVAVLKIEAAGLPTLPMGDSDKVRPGEFVLAIGDPFGVGETVTMGIVSATGRGNLDIEDYEDFIQTDAAINPGNSGGALIDSRGSLVGINTAILSGGGGGNQGIGFAIPINLARQIMGQILHTGHVVRGYLGVLIQPVTPSLAKAFGLSEVKGALVGDVTPDSPASRAGLAKGDVILALDGAPIRDSLELRLKVAQMAPGTQATLEVVRDGQHKQITVKLGELKEKAQAAASAGGESGPLAGVKVEDLTADIANQIGVDPATSGVVIDEVAEASPAAQAGLARGDVIEQVNRKPVPNTGAFDRAARAAGDAPALLLVNHQGATSFVVVTPD